MKPHDTHSDQERSSSTHGMWTGETITNDSEFIINIVFALVAFPANVIVIKGLTQVKQIIKNSITFRKKYQSEELKHIYIFLT